MKPHFVVSTQHMLNYGCALWFVHDYIIVLQMYLNLARSSPFSNHRTEAILCAYLVYHKLVVVRAR